MRRFDRLDAIIAGGSLAFVMVVALLVYALHLRAALRRLTEERALDEQAQYDHTERPVGDQLPNERAAQPHDEGGRGREKWPDSDPLVRPPSPRTAPTHDAADPASRGLNGAALLAKVETPPNVDVERAYYAARFALFSVTWDGADMPSLHRFLGQCDPRFRGWEWGWLRALGEKRSVRLQGGLEEPRELMFSPDGTLLAVACHEKGLHMFDVSCGSTGELNGGDLLYVLPDADEFHLPLAFSPDSRRFVYPGLNDTVLVFDAALGRSIMGLKGHKNSVNRCAWSPDGELVASGGYDGLVILWDAETGEEVHRLSAPPGQEGYACIQAVTFDRQGRLLASSDNRGRVGVWDVRSGRRRGEFTGGGRPWFYRPMRFSPDGGRLAGVAMSKHVAVWDVRGRKPQPVVARPLKNISYPAVSDDLRLFAHEGHGGGVRVLDLVTGRKLKSLPGGPQSVVKVRFDPAGKTIASGYRDGTVKVWDIGTGVPLFVASGHRRWIEALAFSPDGARLASSSGDGTARIWRIGGRPIRRIDHNASGGSAFDASWSRLAAVRWNGKLDVWDVGEQARLKEFSTGTKMVSAVAWNTIGNLIACGGNDHKVRILDADSGEELVTIVHPRQLHFVAFDPKGERLFSGCEAGVMKVTEVETGREVASLKAPSEAIPCYALSPDASRIAAGAYRRGPITIHETATGKMLLEIDRDLDGYEHGIIALAFSPDGRLIASACEDRTVRTWVVPDAGQQLALEGHTNRVTSVAFGPDGERLASGSWDGTVRIWDTASGIELLKLLTGKQPPKGLAFSPDGKKLAVFCSGEALIYEAAPYREE